MTFGIDPAPVPRSMRRRVLRGTVGVLLTGVAFYFVLPRVVDAFSVFPKLSTVGVGWIAVVVACEAASFLMVWMLLRLATRTRVLHPQCQFGRRRAPGIG